MKKHLSDEKLVEQSRAGDTASLDSLMQRFKPLVKAKVKAYYLASGDPEDLIQEGMIGLYKAVLDFDPAKNAAFAAFASLCVVRQVQTAIKTAARQKHIPLNTSRSLNESSPDDSSFLDKLPDHRVSDPEALFLDREALKNIDDFIRHHLSTLEYNVLMLHIDGKTHAEIAEVLGKNTKSIDNTLQRIRKKIKKEQGLKP